MQLSDTHYLPYSLHSGTKAMMFVDGENLAIRYKNVLRDRSANDWVKYKPDVYVWSNYLNVHNHGACEVVRRYYYTSTPGDQKEIDAVQNELKETGIQAPRVFHKPRGKRAKRVDIQLATDMLTHAHRRNYDLAILVAGDQDYVPLVEAVQSEGKRVVVWFFSEGLSPDLMLAADHVFNVAAVFFGDRGTFPFHFPT
jgi:uncharacterized LabA/DUF88 family protein